MNTLELLNEALSAFNQIPNKKIDGEFKSTYDLAAAIGQHLRDNDFENGGVYSDDLVTLVRGEEVKQDNTFTIRSSHGTLTADKITGEVLTCKMNDDDDIDGHELQSIERFDVKEHCKYHNIETIDDSVDILDLGYWWHNGLAEIYEEPEHDWRFECLSRWVDENMMNK